MRTISGETTAALTAPSAENPEPHAAAPTTIFSARLPESLFKAHQAALSTVRKGVFAFSSTTFAAILGVTPPQRYTYRYRPPLCAQKRHKYAVKSVSWSRNGRYDEQVL